MYCVYTATPAAVRDVAARTTQRLSGVMSA